METEQTTALSATPLNDTISAGHKQALEVIQNNTRARGKHLTFVEKEVAKQKITELSIAGVSNYTIAKELKLNLRTVQKLYREATEEYIAHKTASRESLVSEYVQRAEKGIKELEMALSRTDDPRDKASIRTMLNQHINAYADKMQSMGFLPKIKEQVQSDNTTKIVFEMKKPRSEETDGTQNSVGADSETG